MGWRSVRRKGLPTIWKIFLEGVASRMTMQLEAAGS